MIKASSPEGKTPFAFTQIEGFLSLEEATKELVHVAQCMQSTHTFEAAGANKATMQHLFALRKQSLDALLGLIERYIDQMPED